MLRDDYLRAQQSPQAADEITESVVSSGGRYEDNKSRNGSDDDVVLLRSPDPVKDQSYFLCNLRQEQLRRCVFPIGHLHKRDVRALAEKFTLPTKDRKDSQGICFLGKLKFDDFIEHYLGQQPGPIRSVDTDDVIGTHRGLWFHTIGQRKGLGPWLKPEQVYAGPWYVCGKDVPHNTLYVSNDTRHADTTPSGPAQKMLVEQINWINGIPKDLLTDPASTHGEPKRVTQMKLRHSAYLVPGRMWLDVSPRTNTSGSNCTPHCGAAVVDSASWSSGERVRVEILEEGVTVAPGQFVAFYEGDMCLGAGVVADLPAPPPVVKLNVTKGRAMAAATLTTQQPRPRRTPGFPRNTGRRQF
jgi:tRNA U34 2-thiouridine synthase MnmA/TrmU